MIGRMLIILVRGYQRFISPLKPKTCRFLPTCSEYAAQALSHHGAWHGGWLAAKRICRCHPWGGHGWDPIPDGATSDPAAPDRLAQAARNRCVIVPESAVTAAASSVPAQLPKVVGADKGFAG